MDPRFFRPDDDAAKDLQIIRRLSGVISGSQFGSLFGESLGHGAPYSGSGI
jgi:hypothetical protein